MSSNLSRFAFRAISFGILLLGLTLMMHRDVQAASLQPHALVEGEVIHMGDVLEGPFADPAMGKIAVTQAPAPGDSVVLSAQTLINIAFKHNIQIDNPAGISRVVVKRAGVAVPQSVILDRLREQLDAQGLTGDYEIRLQGRPPALSVALNQRPDVHVDGFQYDARTKRFQAQLYASDTAQAGAGQMVFGTAVPVVKVPVLVQRLDKSTVITDADVTYVSMDSAHLGSNVALDASDLIGMSPRRPLPAGRPINLRDVQEPIVVRRGAVVTMLVSAPGLTLTASGQSLEDGSMGKVIRIINTDTHQTVTAQVIGPNQVRANIGGPLVTAELAR